jgi:SAM-dependent methyltransferase
MSDDAGQFYQQLAQDYHLIYADWARSIQWQSNVLDRLIRAQAGDPPLEVLDCTCGIGTQAIGLAAKGYHVHATDISPAAVERAAHEAAAYGVSLSTSVADVRRLSEQVDGSFDVVLSCDNALPHLLADDDLLRAARQMHGKLRANGLLLVSIRDYDHFVLEKPHATLPDVFEGPEGRRIVFQVWDWHAGGQQYTINLFILRQADNCYQTTCYSTTYRALLRSDLSAILQQSGFADIRWYMPQDTGYYQPIVTARPA